MSADTAADSAAPSLNLTAEEKRVYGDLFKQADPENLRVVPGDAALSFFDKTRLDSRVLGEIWQIADKENRGFLTPAGFGIVLRLIGHAQAGREPRPDLAFQQGPLPRFDGLHHHPASAASPPPPTSPAAIQPQGTGGALRIPPLTPDKVAQYTALFERQPLQANMLAGEQARQIFDKSGLPNETLGRIWALADTELRGALVLPEFVIAMHLLASMKTGALRALPSVLPAGLYEAATQRASPLAANRQSPANTGLSAIPRQLSGSAQPRAASPLGRPPMLPPQATGAAAGDWAITPADKERFDQIYVTLDKAKKGYITGDEAVPFFSQSNLSEDALAQIWDLADFNGQGQLTPDGFAIAMYLIRQQRSSRSAALPSTLPPNLVPPGIRNQARPTVSAAAFDPPPMTQPPPQPKSALEDLFGLDSSPSGSAPAAPAQTTMSTGGSNVNDPFAGGSSALSPSSPVKTHAASFKPFVPFSSFGKGLTAQPSGGDAPKQPHAEDLLEDNDPEASKKITGETTELANLSNQIGSLAKQMQDVQGKRTTTQNELNQTNSQKQNFEQRLAQLRTLYEKEAQDTRALEEQLRKSRSETQKLQSECLTLEGTCKEVQAQHQQVLAALQADQQENANLRERIRAVSGEIAQLKPQVEKLRSEARQQKGLVAINKKQVAATEGERDKLKAEAESLAKGGEDVFRQMDSGSPVPASAQVASPSLSTASGNNPFFKRTASTDIMGAFASPPARAVADKSFDDVFGPSAPPPPAAFKQQDTGNSAASAGSFNTTSSTPNLSRQATLSAEPPPPPESKQINSSFLPFPDHSESLSSSRQVSPPASRADGSAAGSSNPFPGETASTGGSAAGAPAASGSEDDEKSETPSATPVPGSAHGLSTAAESSSKAPPGESGAGAAGGPDVFGKSGQAKAKADFDNAFAAFTGSNKSQGAGAPEGLKSQAAFDSEFPPISELEREDDSDSDSERGGFDDDFAPASPQKEAGAKQSSGPGAATAETADASSNATVKEPTPPAESANKSAVQSPSPVAVTNSSAAAPKASSLADDIFGSAAPGPAASAPGPANTAAKGAFDDLDDDFEGLEDAKEGSADEDFANISRDDFNPVFDSSPPASQTKSESTAFGNESSFDFVSSHPGTNAPAAAGGSQQKAADNHDWDAIFAGLDSPSAVAAPAINHPGGASNDDKKEPRPPAPGRALTEQGEHDDPILKNLTGMGYSRADAVAALEKYDYNLERAANYLASQS